MVREAKAAHVQCCLPGQDMQVMLDTDDLDYDSEYDEEEDYGEGLETEHLEQPAMGGELHCTCLAQMEPLGVATGLPGLCWGDISIPLPVSGSLCPLAGRICDLQPSVTQVGGVFPITVLCTPHTLDPY